MKKLLALLFIASTASAETVTLLSASTATGASLTVRSTVAATPTGPRS